MSSVISASRLWEGRISLSLAGYEVSVCVMGLFVGEEGLTSERIAIGEMAWLISIGTCWSLYLGDFGVKAVARDINSTIIGRTCFPSP